MSVVQQLEIVRERAEALTSALIALNSMVAENELLHTALDAAWRAKMRVEALKDMGEHGDAKCRNGIYKSSCPHCRGK